MLISLGTLQAHKYFEKQTIKQLRFTNRQGNMQGSLTTYLDNSFHRIGMIFTMIFQYAARV